MSATRIGFIAVAAGAIFTFVNRKTLKLNVPPYR